MRRTLLATLVLGPLLAGTALAGPIVVGQWTWTDDPLLGSLFDVTNTSGSPLEYPALTPLAPGQGWQPGPFTSVVITLAVPANGACPDDTSDCAVTLLDVGAGASGVNLEFVDPLGIAAATLTLAFRGHVLTSAIGGPGEGGLLLLDFTPVPVPEPAGLALVALGAAAWLARRGRAHS